MPRCVAPEDLASTVHKIGSGFEGAYQISALRWDGSRFPAELQSKQGKLGERPVRIAAVRDISERERTLKLLHASEEHLRDLARGAFDFMVLTQRGVVVDVGGNFSEVMGYARDQVVGRAAAAFSAMAWCRAERAAGTRRLALRRPSAPCTALKWATGCAHQGE
jgi:PAS domain-containing protein